MAVCDHHYLVLLGLLCLFSCTTTLEINAAEFATRLTKICKEGLGQSKIQELFKDNAEFTTTGILGHEIVRKLAASVGKNFKNYSDAIWKLYRQFIERPVNSTPPEAELNITECCKVKPEDRLNSICYRHHSGSAEQVAYHKDILETMKEIAGDIPNIGWQYYGNEDGLLVHYPAQQATSCTEYDHRLRFWYAEASSPVPKDIVIAIESTGHKNTSVIWNAVNTFLNTVNPNDRITVIKFGRGVRFYLGLVDQSTCFSQYLALGTPQNIRLFKEFINSTEGNEDGTFELSPVIDKAFDYFMNAEDATERRKLLVILVAGAPVDVPSELIGKITAKNGALQREVVIQTYAFGSNTSNHTKDILLKIAESTHFETSTGKVKTGTFTHIKNGNELRRQLHPYYSIFADSAKITAPSVTVPYFDFFNLGLVVSFCLPLNRGDKLEGVTCVDAKLEDIFFNVTYYDQGIDAYGFIIDSRGRTMLHPLLPKPTEVSEDTKFINILSLERDHGVREVIESMKSGGNGSRRVHTSRLTPKLGLVADSPRSQNALLEYYWTKVPGTDYSLCMVFSSRDREVEIVPKLNKQQDDEPNYIHPYTLTHNKEELHTKCHHNGQVATTDGSVVMFSGAAYKLLFVGVNWNNSEQHRRYDNFFKGSADDQAPEFKESTKQWVRITGHVDTIWTQRTKYDLHIVWRHLVTASGVMRVYPGVNYTQYNPNSLSWYKQAILSQDVIHLHPVERQNSFNVMISQAILESSSAAIPIAVVGGEIRPTILYHILEDVYPACRKARCFILDGDGNILVHRLYNNKEVRPSHIIAMEPAIAQHLIDKKHLVEAQCLDFLSQYRTLFNWKVAIKGWYVSSTSPKFELQPVQGTNIFVGIAWDNEVNSCNCTNLTKCRNDNYNMSCKCPCYKILQFNLCNNTLPENGNIGPSACSILRKEFDIMPTDSDISQLKPCFSPCDDIKLKSNCAEKDGCHWCLLNGEKESGCHDRLYCDPAVRPMRVTSWVNVAVPVVLCLLVLVLIVVLCCIIKYFPGLQEKLCVKKHIKTDQNPPRPSGGHSTTVPADHKYFELDDSGMASEDPNERPESVVLTIPNPEIDVIPPLPKRHQLQQGDSMPSSDHIHPQNQKQVELRRHPQSRTPLQPNTPYASVYSQSQTLQRSLAEGDDTSNLYESAKDTSENVYANKVADIQPHDHEGDSLSLNLPSCASDGQMVTDNNTRSDNSDLGESQGYVAWNGNSVASSRVISEDSGMASGSNRPSGNKQTYLKHL